MTARQIVDQIIDNRRTICHQQAEAFAPANIALCKYWGKRDTQLNLPLTSSLSISLGKLGSQCTLKQSNTNHDSVILNNNELAPDSKFVTRLTRYLDLFRPDNSTHYQLETNNTIPTAAGFASSASGFASLVLALNKLHNWQLNNTKLSILARLGSGSACRSLWQGFVEWHAGKRDDGMDSFAEPLTSPAWPELKIGLLVLTSAQKPIGSREAMQRTAETSILYRSWPDKVATDINTIRQAISEQDFRKLGSTAESNALAMHATMMASLPPVLYWLPESVEIMHRIWQLRADGLPLYLTMDAGPNIKLLFQNQHRTDIQREFPNIIIA
jgi:diphosphomevalonate decarboxylase